MLGRDNPATDRQQWEEAGGRDVVRVRNEAAAVEMKIRRQIS